MPRMSVGKYIATRISSLKPPGQIPPNPISVLRLLNARQWQFFFIAFAGWTWDAFDFFTVSMTVTSLAKEFERTKADITWGITLVLMLRSVGAITFGLAADKWGRKWPFIFNNILFIILEMGTGFCKTYEQFLGVRALFGIAMGGIYGNCATTALEDAPKEARGILSGMLQQGYAFGYLLAVVFARAFVNNETHVWRPLFWFGACPPVLIIVGRLMLPETNSFLERQAIKREQREGVEDIEKVVWNEAKIGLKKHWLLLVYLVLMMAGFNFISHGSQDLYPTMLENQLDFSANKITVTQTVANLGAILGGTVVGYSSQMLGRRLSILVVCAAGLGLLYTYCFTRSNAVIAAAFWEQFCVQGAWGVVPIHLVELSPASARTTIVGTAYQLGNLASSASSTIEATIGERFRLSDNSKGDARYDYGRVMFIFMACVYVYVIILVFIGPEKMGRDMIETPGAGEYQEEWEQKPRREEEAVGRP